MRERTVRVTFMLFVNHKLVTESTVGEKTTEEKKDDDRDACTMIKNRLTSLRMKRTHAVKDMTVQDVCLTIGMATNLRWQ